MNLHQLYSRERFQFRSVPFCLVFRNAVDLLFPLRSGALPHVGDFPRVLATTMCFYEMEVLLIGVEAMLPLTRFFTMIGPCLGTVLPSETRPFLGLHGGCVARTERNATDCYK